MKETLIESRTIFQGRAISLRIDRIQKKSGKEIIREIVWHPDCVAAVVLDEQNNVILERQFRHPIGKALLEIPAGGIESGEEPEDTVRRELQEEIGYLPGKLTRLCGFYMTPGYCTEYLHLYLAEELQLSRLTAEDTSEIEVVRVPLTDIRKLIDNGQICDAKSIAGLLWVIASR